MDPDVSIKFTNMGQDAMVWAVTMDQEFHNRDSVYDLNEEFKDETDLLLVKILT